jgi:ubiquinone/menaquinone biosynthesis C-methylase UbiE
MRVKTGNQYKDDIFNKLGFMFEPGRKMLDCGCGDGSDAKVFINHYRLKVCGIDIYEHPAIKKIKGLEFKKGSIFKIPYKNNFFDYVFLHDVLHHIDKNQQRYEKHIQGLKEIKRVCRKNGIIIILEGNRYNPLFYPHMVLIKKHNHFTQKYFKKLIQDVFGNWQFRGFEAHFYPQKFLKIYERIIEKISLYHT